MKKRILSLICSAVIVFSLIPALAVDAVPQEYWAIQAEYRTATESNNDDGILLAVEKLNKLFPDPTSVDEANMVAWPMQKAAAICEKRGEFTNKTVS